MFRYYPKYLAYIRKITMKKFDTIISKQEITDNKNTREKNIPLDTKLGNQEKNIAENFTKDDYNHFVLHGIQEQKSAERAFGVVLKKAGVLNQEESLKFQKGVDTNANLVVALKTLNEHGKDKTLEATISTLDTLCRGVEHGVMTYDDMEYTLKLMGEKRKVTQEISKIRKLIGLKDQKKDPAVEGLHEQIKQIEDRCQKSLLQKDLEIVKELYEYVKENQGSNIFPKNVEQVLYSARFGPEVYMRTNTKDYDLAKQELGKYLSREALEDLSDLQSLYNNETISKHDFNILLKSILSGSNVRDVIKDQSKNKDLERSIEIEKGFEALSAMKTAVRVKKISHEAMSGYFQGLKEERKKKITSEKEESSKRFGQENEVQGQIEKGRENDYQQEKITLSDFLNRVYEVGQNLDKEVILQERETTKDKKLMGGAMGSATFLELKNDGAAIFKTYERQTDSDRMKMINREKAAYQVSLALGLDIVPPTVIREIDRKAGSVQEFIPDAKTAHEETGEIDPNERIKLDIFDAIIVNDFQERHGGNYLIKNGKIIAIDHGAAFGSFHNLLPWAIMDTPIPKEITQNLKRFSSSEKNKTYLRNQLVELFDEKTADGFLFRITALTESIDESGYISGSKFGELMYHYNQSL